MSTSPARDLVASDDPRVYAPFGEWTCVYDTTHDVEDVCTCDDEEDDR